MGWGGGWVGWGGWGGRGRKGDEEGRRGKKRVDVGLELVQAETDGERQKQAEADRNRQLQSDWHPCGQLCDVLSVPLANQVYRLIGSAKQPKSSKNASGVPGMSKCGLKVATGGERGGKVLQKVPKR